MTETKRNVHIYKDREWEGGGTRIQKQEGGMNTKSIGIGSSENK